MQQPHSALSDSGAPFSRGFSMLPLFAVSLALGVYFFDLGAWLLFVLWVAPFAVFARLRGFLLVVSLGLALGSFSLAVHRATPPRPLFYLARFAPSLSLEGQILAGPSPAFAADGFARARADIAVSRVGPAPGAPGAWRELTGIVRLTLAETPPGLSPGDWVRVSASLSALPSPQNPHEQDSRARLRGQGIDAVGYGNALVARAGTAPGWLAGLQSKAARALSRATEGESRAVLGALLLGEPGSLPPELRARFAATGTAHLLAVSGGHVAIVVWIILQGFLWLFRRWDWGARRVVPRRAAALASLPLVGLYVAFVGASPSALRAGIASALALTAQSLGRRVAPADLLALSAVLSLALEPEELFGPSLQLSFGAVIGLCAFSPLLQAMFRRKPSPQDKNTSPQKTRAQSLRIYLRSGLVSSLVATTAATLATLPITAWHFRQVALASLWANLALVPVVSLVLPFGLIGVLCALVGADDVAQWIFSCCVSLWDWTGTLLNGLSPARPADLALDAWSVLLCYALFAVLFWSRSWRRLGAGAALLLALWARLPAPGGDGFLRVTFLSVGQGDGIVIELPEGGAVLVDAGGVAVGHDDPGARVVLPFLRSIGVRQLDLVVLSHPHPDHFGGLATVVAEIPARDCWHNGGQSHDPRFLSLISSCAPLSAPKDGPSPFANFETARGGAHLDLLGPARHGLARPYSDENDNSLVFSLRYGERSILFTGDAEKEAESAMVEEKIALHADVLKVGHHASRTSSTQAFLEAVAPRVAVASLGIRNQFKFPHPEVVARYRALGVPLWRTDEGAVIVETNGRALWIHRSEPRTFVGELLAPWRELRGSPLVAGGAP